ncbi:hypothetical protein N9M10_04410 [Hellea sp.]|nr:hypothetical protein [Hellea sp.]
MTRSIEISTDVFAAIWAARIDGEETENQILQRLLSAKKNIVTEKPMVTPSGVINGYYDNRNDVHFPEGFTVYRSYKGKIYTAVATRGQWMLAGNNMRYSSLNKLNESIVKSTENIWNGNWTFVDDDQKSYSIDKKRRKNS